jgi:hypothetical protein
MESKSFFRNFRMGTQLNIKSEDAYRLASRLAELTGESLTTVVQKAPKASLNVGSWRGIFRTKSSACLLWGAKFVLICASRSRPTTAACTTRMDFSVDR